MPKRAVDVSGIPISDKYLESVGNPVGNLVTSVGSERAAGREPIPGPVPDTRKRRSLSLSGTSGDFEREQGIGRSSRDPLVAALARYVEALHLRYPDGPDQMRRQALDGRANMPRMRKSGNGRAA
jgi:hypothetical protein